MTYDGDLKLFSGGVLGDWHPWRSDFRISFGAYYNDNQIDAEAKAQNGVIKINGQDYNVSQIGGLETGVDVKDFSPYIGIGFTGNIGQSPFIYSADLGVLYQGKPDISLKTSTYVDDATLQTNLNAQRRKLEDELSHFRWYPVASISIHYSF